MVEESVVYARIERMSHPTHAFFHHTFDLLNQERKNSAKISPLEGVADVMFKRGTGFMSQNFLSRDREIVEEKLEKQIDSSQWGLII